VRLIAHTHQAKQIFEFSVKLSNKIAYEWGFSRHHSSFDQVCVGKRLVSSIITEPKNNWSRENIRIFAIVLDNPPFFATNCLAWCVWATSRTYLCKRSIKCQLSAIYSATSRLWRRRHIRSLLLVVSSNLHGKLTCLDRCSFRHWGVVPVITWVRSLNNSRQQC